MGGELLSELCLVSACGVNDADGMWQNAQNGVAFGLCEVCLLFFFLC